MLENLKGHWQQRPHKAQCLIIKQSHDVFNNFHEAPEAIHRWIEPELLPSRAGQA
jgi:hypothetical protein